MHFTSACGARKKVQQYKFIIGGVDHDLISGAFLISGKKTWRTNFNDLIGKICTISENETVGVVCILVFCVIVRVSGIVYRPEKQTEARCFCIDFQ